MFVAVLVTAALIVLRSFVFLQYEQADFDSDQAIVGLMATHLSEGTAWPLFFYGQLYMMGVQAWLAAPVFLWLGPTVFALKLPLLLLNVATGALLVVLLVRHAGLRAWQAAIATAWFAALPPLTASRMVQAQGGTIEPLFYALILWLVRQRPVVFGLVFAFGFLQREFTLFAVIGVLLIEAWTRALFDRRRFMHWLVVLIVFLGARQGVGLLRGTASMFGPDTATPALAAGVTNVDVVAGSVCLAPGHVLGNVSWLLRENVPTFFGVKQQPARMLIVSASPTGQPWAWVFLIMGVGGAVWLTAASARRPYLPEAEMAGSESRPYLTHAVFPLFLLVTGLLGLAGVAAGCNVRSVISIRYHLLLALAPVGLTALAFVHTGYRLQAAGYLRTRDGATSDGRLGKPALPSRCGLITLPGLVMILGISGWALTMAWSSARLLDEYRTQPPGSPFRILADDLTAHGDRYGWASYWVSYHVNFLSQERVQLSPTAQIRVFEYARQAMRAGPRAVVIGNDPCDPNSRVARRVEGWWICQ